MTGKKVSTSRSSMVLMTIVVLVYLGLIYFVREMLPMSVFVLLIVLGFISLGLSLKSLFGHDNETGDD